MNVTDHYKFNPKYGRFEPNALKCVYCNKQNRGSDIGECYFARMYIEKGRTNLIMYRNVKYNMLDILIPRCKKCKKRHFLAKTIETILVIIAVLMVFVVPIYLSVNLGGPKILIPIYMAAVVGVFYFIIEGINSFIHDSYGIAKEKEAAKKDILVNEFIRQGWSLKRPLA